MRLSRKLVFAGLLAVACSGDGSGPGNTATQIVWTAQPAPATAGAPLTPAVQVSALDAQGNVARSFSGTVAATLATNPGGATLGGTRTATAVSGVATFTDLTLDRAASGYSLSAATAGLGTATSNTFAVAAGATRRLAFTTGPGASGAGNPITPPIVVTARDSFGNTAIQFTGTVSVALGSNPTGATLTGVKSVSAVGGIATFGSLSVDKAGNYTLVASSSGLVSDTSAFFAISAGGVSAGQSGLVATPDTLVASGGTSQVTITVTARDAQGNPISGATVVLAATGSGNVITQPAAPTNASGVATGTLSSTTAEPKVISATIAGVGVIQQDTTVVVPGAAAALHFTVDPSAAVSNVVVSPAVEVTATDAFGNRARAFGGNITVSLGNNPGGGVLSGTATRPALSGVATFNDLRVDKSGAGYTLVAQAAGLASGTSAGFDITAAAADHLAFTQQPPDAAAGVPLAPAVQVTIQDAAGNRVTSATGNVTVGIADNPNGGALAGLKTVPAVAGVATFSSLSIDKSGTGYTLTATSGGLVAGTSNDFNISAAPANRLSFFVEPSAVTAGSAIGPTVQVEVLDAFGNRAGTAVATVTVSLGANPGGGTLSGTLSRPAASGLAQFNDLRVDKVGAGYTLRANATGLVGDTSVAFTVSPGGATQLVFSVPPSNTSAASTIAPAVVVTARDSLGNTATGYGGSVTVAIGTNAGGGTLSGTTSTSAAAGIASFGDLAIDKIGAGYTLTASAAGLLGSTSIPFAITLGGGTHLGFVTQPAGTTGGMILNPVQIAVLDAGGNRDTTSTVAVTVGLSTNPGNGSLAGTKTVAAVKGLATFPTLTIDSAGIGYRLGASAPLLTGAVSNAFTIGVGPAAAVGFLVQPSNTGAGSPLAPAVLVEVRDLGGNRVTAGSPSITMAIGNNPGAGTLSGMTPVTAVNGLATFTDLSINTPGIGYTLVATSSGLSATSSPFDIALGGGTKLAFVVQPGNTTGGATLAPAVQVEIQDAGGNRDTTANNTITMALGVNPNSGVLTGTKSVAAAKGLASFSALAIDSAGAGYTLSATASGLTGAISSAFDVTAGQAAKVGFLVQPLTTSGGSVLSAVKVEVRDAGGNRVLSGSDAVTLAIATNPNGGTLAGTTSVAAASGVATFSDLRIDSAGSGYRLSAAAAGLAGGSSSSFDIVVGVPAQLGFVVQPSDATAGTSIGPAPAIEIRDAGGNRVTTAASSVTVAFGANPGGGTLTGTKSHAAVGGVATFPGLGIDKAATGYTLHATSGGLASATSGAFDIAADGVDAAQSSLSAATDTIGQCTFSCVAGVHASTVTVTAKDRFGNLVSGSPVVLSASGSGAAFTPSTGNTDAGGHFVAAFMSSVAEGKTVGASAGGVTIAQTATVTTMPVLVGAGDIADCNSIRDDATANQLDSIPGVVFAAGDNAYANGTATNFANCYDPTWGRHKSRTRPVVGNHEYDSSGTAAPYFAYFTPAVADPLGNGFGYYSFDLGTWHVVVLNTDSAVTNPVSGQLAWLQGDLVGRSSQCVLAIWHRPLFTSGSSNGGSTRIRRLWQALEDAGAEIVINGHDHLYERFAPQDSLGNATPAGMREFIVGTGGGETHAQYVNSPANVEASDGPTTATFSRGLLRLTLLANSYRWEFLPAHGQGSFTDSGNAACH